MVAEQRDYGLVDHTFPAELRGRFENYIEGLSSLETAWNIIVNPTFAEELICTDLPIQHHNLTAFYLFDV